MELQRLQRVVVDALEDIKAQDIKVFNTVGQSDMFDRVVVATGNSNRQTRALAWHVVQKVKEAGGAVTSVEGTDPGEWVLVDLGDIVVHLMQPTIRQYYALEEMWGAKPVRIKLAADRRPSLAPSVDEDEAPARRVAAPRPAVSAAATKKAPARKAPAKKALARKAPVRTGPAAKAPSKKSPAKAVRKSPAKAARKSPARPAAKAPAQRVAARKAVGATPPRKSASGAKGAKAAKTAKAATSRRTAAGKRRSASR